MGSLSEANQRRLQLAGEKGASSCLSVLPIREFGFALHKRHFVCDMAGCQWTYLFNVFVGRNSPWNMLYHV